MKNMLKNGPFAITRVVWTVMSLCSLAALLISTGCEDPTGNDEGSSSSGDSVTLRQYYEVRGHMTYAEVKAIMGRDATRKNQIDYSELEAQWLNGDGSYILVYFDPRISGYSAFEKQCAALKNDAGEAVYLVDSFYTP